jgi:hypothetical protein
MHTNLIKSLSYQVMHQVFICEFQESFKALAFFYYIKFFDQPSNYTRIGDTFGTQS